MTERRRHMQQHKQAEAPRAAGVDALHHGLAGGEVDEFGEGQVGSGDLAEQHRRDVEGRERDEDPAGDRKSDH